MVGQMVGKYRVVSRLGRGGMGTVYKAVDETLDREVAIKCLNPDVGDAEVLKRFRAEAVTLARLNHPNIATLFELTEHHGDLLMVMEFVRGETFDVVSHRTGPMTVERAAQLCGQVFDALGHAHRAGVVHRDLKPANLMLTESGLVKVMDFGLARMAGTEHLTNDGYMVGTPAYMSPEQVLGWEIDGRADIYAMGVVLFRLLTGQLPFKADSGIAMAHKQINDPPTPVRQLRTELSWEIEEVLKCALAKPPGDRYQTAEAFKAALSAVVYVPEGPSAEATPTLAISSSNMVSELARATPASPSPVTTAPPASMTGPSSRTAPVPPPVPEAPVVVAPPGQPVPAAHRMPMAAVAVGVMLLVGLPAFFFWRSRAAHPAVTEAPSAPSQAAPVQAGAVTGSPTDSSTTPAAALATNPPTTPPVNRGPGSPTAVAKVRDAGVVRATRGATEASSAPAFSSEALPVVGEPARAARPVLTTVIFSRMKLLTLDEGKSRDRDASLRLGSDGLQVLAEQRTVIGASYDEVVGLFHSHSREPRWVTPDGTATLVGKAGGKFSFFKGVPDGITVRTRKAFIPLRVQDDDLPRIIRELETRTGTKVVRAR